MPKQPLQFEELSPLLAALCDGTIDGDGFSHLERLLADDPSARQWYIAYMDLHGDLSWDHKAHDERSAQTDDRCLITPKDDESSTDHSSSITHHSSPSSPYPLIIAPLCSPHSPLPSFIGSPLFSYLLAALIVAAGLVVGACVYVSQPSSIALPSPSGRGAGGEGGSNSSAPSIVARITGMVDCVWETKGLGIRDWGLEKRVRGEGGIESDPPLSPLPSPLVRLGDRLALRSGLLEITYITGARVILQGPVTYEVESATGGYLSLGKLTARLESGSGIFPNPKRQRRTGGTDDSNGSANPLTSDLCPLTSRLFAVRTPTAVVTDLGTEFGVEVDKQGCTTSHVFRGAVEVHASTKDGQPYGTPVRLSENESVQVKKGQGGAEAMMKVLHGTDGAAAFVRVDQLPQLAQQLKQDPMRRWQAYSRQLLKDPAMVAHYTFESVGNSSWLLQNMAATGHALDGEIRGPLWTSGRFTGKLALRFRSQGAGDKVVLPEQQRFNFTTPFSIAVWFKVSHFPTDSIPSLIAKGSAWRIQGYDNNINCLTIATNGKPINGQVYGMPQPQTEVDDGRWHLLVGIVEPGDASHRKRLYMDGRLEGEIDVPAPLAINDSAVLLGNSTFADRDYEGLIDEVAILARALSAKEIKEMFEAGNPAVPFTKGKE